MLHLYHAASVMMDSGLTSWLLQAANGEQMAALFLAIQLCQMLTMQNYYSQVGVLVRCPLSVVRATRGDTLHIGNGNALSLHHGKD